MSEKGARLVEVTATVVIAVVLLFGGSSLLVALGRYPHLALPFVAVIIVAQLVALRRALAGRSEHARLLATRDITFLAASLFALFAIGAPARWSIGACIAAAEFALALDVLLRLSPSTEESAP